MKKIFAILLASGFLFTSIAFANQLPSLQESKKRMQVLDSQIASLKRNLSANQNKRKRLTTELASMEREIGLGIVRLKAIQENISLVEKNMQTSREKIDALQKTLNKHQANLSEYIRTRYQIGAYQPVKWLLNQENPYAISRLLTYYQYLIQSRQTLIHHIQETHQTLDEQTKQLQMELEQSKKLQEEQALHQNKLEQDKARSSTLIHTLKQEILSAESSLQEANHNKSTLARLIQSLSMESNIPSIQRQPDRPFLNMRRKLPYPVNIRPQALRKMNQGVTFFAEEGAPVRSVHAGKVVFSEWLKGYGLLLIIDHGRGFMTLYAHNQALFKHKGQTVRQGEVISSVGHTGGLQQNGLYFEVRQHGKAIPPLAWFS